MRPWSGLGSRIVTAIEQRQDRNRLSDPGPMGDFYRNGGNALLYAALPLTETDWVLDAGGYHGEWTAGILAHYGCRSEIFEPVPAFVQVCRDLFARNGRVRLHEAAIGATNTTVTFSLADVGTSAFVAGESSNSFEARVIGISDFLQQRGYVDSPTDRPGAIGCLKLNIEGGEYEVLEALLATGEIGRFRCLLIQFHRQPADYEQRYQQIIAALATTHERIWGYPMVWERWDLKTLEQD